MSVEVPRFFPSDAEARDNLLAYMMERAAAELANLDHLPLKAILRLADKYKAEWLMLHRGD